MKSFIKMALIATVIATQAPASPAIFNPSIEAECLMKWFELTPQSTTDDLANAYNAIDPLRLSAVLNICAANAGGKIEDCGESCAAEVQVKSEMRRREGTPLTLESLIRDYERLR